MRLIRRICTLLTIAALMAINSGCENKWPKNGDLDGMWQLMSKEENGTVTQLKDTKHYWSIRANLVQYTSTNMDYKRYSHFERQDAKLILTDFCNESRNADESDNDEWITFDDRTCLNEWGIYPDTDTNHPERLTQTFNIEHLDSDCLILSAGTYKLQFRKF